jgi:ATP-dependent helicase/nuclease subunit A
MKIDTTGPRPTLDLNDPDLSLTGPQKAAMQIDQELLVTAGAGAGKTHTLSLRYVALLLEQALCAIDTDSSDPRPRIESVLVLTFTDRAAQEMAARCHVRLLDLAHAARRQREQIGSAYGTDLARALPLSIARLLDQFDAACISTFHGFCSRIHAEHPLECGAQAGADLLSPEEAAYQRSVVLDQVLEEFGAATPADWRALLSAFGSRLRVVEAVENAMAGWGRLQPVLSAHAAGSVSLGDLSSLAAFSPQEVTDWITHTGVPTLQALVDLTANSGGGRHVQGVVAPLLERLVTLPTDPIASALAMQEVLASLLTSGRLRSFSHAGILGTKAQWGSEPERVAAREDLGDLAVACADWPELAVQAATLPTRADAAMLESLQPFSRLVGAAAERIAETWVENGCLDFDALQRNAVQAVLHHEHLAQHLVDKHRYLMVDEFQDTDEAQWDLVRRLGRPEGCPSDRIFLVGDAKQAIYGFRGGDVTVYRAAARDLGVTPLVFPHNFRSRVELIEWFNDSFSRILGEDSGDRPDWEAVHAPLLPGRDQTGGTVRLVLHDAPRGSETAEAEAQAIAGFLAGQVLPGAGVFADLDLQNTRKHPTPPIAILIRARTHLGTFEAALRAQGISFQVGGGVGFWLRPEVVDLVNLLHALASESQVSLVGALRSPLFGLPDDQIEGLVQGLWGVTLSELGRENPLSDTAPAALVRAHHIWGILLASRRSLPWPLLLRLALDELAVRHVVDLEEPGRGWPNVLQLVEHADQLAAGGAVLLETGAERLMDLVRQEQRGSEAEPSAGEARVFLMTVHAAKGLEFPVVVLPGMGDPPVADTHPLLAQRIAGKWHLACRVEDPAGAVQSRVAPGAWHALDQQRKREADAERRRLLYVGVTRARDHLLLLGRRAGIGRDTWVNLVCPEEAAPGDRHLQLTPADSLSPPPLPPAGLPLPPPGLALDLPTQPQPLVLSPSGLDRLHACPARWYRSAVLGLPEPPGKGDDPGVSSRAESTVRGTVFHRILEQGLLGDMDQAQRCWTREATKEGLPVQAVERGWKQLQLHLANAMGSASLAQCLSRPGQNELGVQATLGDVVLRGVLDRLWQDPETGAWNVLDYKTDHLEDQADLDRATKAHSLQLLAYGWAANQILAGAEGGECRGGQIFFSARGDWVDFPPWSDQDFRRVEDCLHHAAKVAQSDWLEVLAEARAGTEERPCDSCGYLGKGCPGVSPGGAP